MINYFCYCVFICLSPEIGILMQLFNLYTFLNMILLFYYAILHFFMWISGKSSYYITLNYWSTFVLDRGPADAKHSKWAPKIPIWR